MGGTYTRIASTNDLNEIYKIEKFNTKKDLTDQINIVNYTIKKLSESQKIKAICLGVPGTLDIENKRFLKFHNYKVLENKEFGTFFRDELKSVPLIVVNDAHMAGYCEAVKGAAKNYSSMLYISIGTGIGGAWIRNKNTDDVFVNFEPGHLCIFSDGLDFEDHCSGRAFSRIYNVDTNENTPPQVWKSYSKDLLKGLLFLNKKFPSEVIVLGGGFSVNNFKYFEQYLNIISNNLNIKVAEFGDNSGILGGFELLSKSI